VRLEDACARLIDALSLRWRFARTGPTGVVDEPVVQAVEVEACRQREPDENDAPGDGIKRHAVLRAQ
jgi:hypothetical protein